VCFVKTKILTGPVRLFPKGYQRIFFIINMIIENHLKVIEASDLIQLIQKIILTGRENMNKFKEIRHPYEDSIFQYHFYCPGCKTIHAISPKVHKVTGDLKNPTVSPSVLATSGHYMPGNTGTCWCQFDKEHPDDPSGFKCYRCHSFIKDGKIQFLSDCTHDLKGCTVGLPDIELFD